MRDDPATFEIRVEGRISESWSSWFEGMSIYAQESGETILRGPLADQSALHGVLARVRELGLPLLAVRRLDRTE